MFQSQHWCLSVMRIVFFLLLSFRLWKMSSHENCRNRKCSLRWVENLNVSTLRHRAESPNSTPFPVFTPLAHNFHAQADALKGCFSEGIICFLKVSDIRINKCMGLKCNVWNTQEGFILTVKDKTYALPWFAFCHIESNGLTF